MKKIEGARLVLFNHALAKRLGLQLPRDPKALERLILDRFAYRTALPDENSDQTFFATRYQDSGSKRPGDALGDGRAVWTGEVRVRRQNQPSETQFIDFVMKGVGQTPLAWLNHSDPLHKDGLQSMEEAVHSFIMSEINLRNELDSTADLAVIELPLEKKDKHTGKVARAALTIRVGNQTRIAHFRYFSDRPELFKVIFDYCVRRDLGLSDGTLLKRADYNRYFERLAQNLAEEAARYYDLHAVHSSPTPGNRTTQGSTIDLGTFRYLDAHHVEYSYLFDQLKLKDQTAQLRGYIDWVFQYLRSTSLTGLTAYRRDQTVAMFYEAFERRLTDLWLNRLGLDSSQIAKVKPKTRKAIYSTLISLSEMTSPETTLFGDRKLHPALYDVRRVLKHSVEFVSGSTADVSGLFENDRTWALKATKGAAAKNLESAWVKTVRNVLKEVSANENDILMIVARAAVTGAIERYEPGRSFYLKHEKPVLDTLRAGGDYGMNTRMALDAVRFLVDQRLPKQKTTNLGAPERIAVYSGTFDPPHLGHRQVIERTLENFGISKIYVVTNVTSAHKQNISPYEDRKAMTALAFKNDSRIITNDASIEEAFRSGDMQGVMDEVARRHPDALLFHVMGNDSFERMIEQPGADHPPRTVLISAREAVEPPLPSITGQNPIITIENPGEAGISSTAIRRSVAENEAAAQSYLDPSVARYIRKRKLYAIEAKPTATFAPRCSDLLHIFRWRSEP